MPEFTKGPTPPTFKNLEMSPEQLFRLARSVVPAGTFNRRPSLAKSAL